MLGGFHDPEPLVTLFLVAFLLVVIISSESGSAIATTSNFSENLKSRINNLISEELNDTGSLLNFTNLINNGSNLTTNQLVLSNNNVISSINSNGSNDGNSIVIDRVTTINGICNSEKVGGNGNDTLTSSGNCNDELTGGRGSDKFMCGEGNDTVRDYNSKEGDIILDKQNCEKIL